MRITEIDVLHEQIYETLRANRLTKNKTDFCRSFLGRSRTYLSTIAHGHHEPTAHVFRSLKAELGKLLDLPLRSETKLTVKKFIADVDSKIFSLESAGYCS